MIYRLNSPNTQGFSIFPGKECSLIEITLLATEIRKIEGWGKAEVVAPQDQLWSLSLARSLFTTNPDGSEELVEDVDLEYLQLQQLAKRWQLFLIWCLIPARAFAGKWGAVDQSGSLERLGNFKL